MPSDYKKIRENNIKEYGEGTRHLAFLHRLYADRTHFIFELLQNAEDAGASRIRFRLFEDRLKVTHDGHVFNEYDVRGVCGVDEGTKADDLTQIGKFGIGFKSVYAYTDSPEVHSGEEDFKIENYIRPSRVRPKMVETPWTTLFVFPFDKPKVGPEKACQEIGRCLCTLNARTLLFLREIKEIKYELPDINGVYKREEVVHGSARRVEVLGQNNGQEENEKWLIFRRPLKVPDNSEKVFVEVAFRLEPTAEARTESIERENNTPLVVYFPTEKDTKLGFLIQGPYRTTPARDNVPEHDNWNKTLVRETAELVVESLRALKGMGLLSVSVLEALPIRKCDFSDNMFSPIFGRVVEALAKEALLPTNDGTFVAARNAKLVRGADLTNLLDRDQLRELFQSGDDIEWLSTDITQDRAADLWSYLTNELQVDVVEPETFARSLSKGFLAARTDAWFRRFYEFLSRQPALWRQPRDILRTKPILRLQNDSHVKPFQDDNSPNAYLAAESEIGTHLRIVKIALSSDDAARQFLCSLGIPELDFVTEVIESILQKYTEDKSFTIDRAENERDLQKVKQAYETDSQEKKEQLQKRLASTSFIPTENRSTGKTVYRKPGEVYLENDDLRTYFGGNASFASTEVSGRFAAMFRDLGVEEHVRVRRKKGDGKGCVSISHAWGSHERGHDGFDPSIQVDGLQDALSGPTLKKGVFIWNEIAIPNLHCIRGIVEKSSRQTYEDSTKEERISAEFGELLTGTAWLPDSNGDMYKPGDLALEDLPESFNRNQKLADQLGMKKSHLTKLAKEAGVSVATFILASRIEEAPPEIRRKVNSVLQGGRQKPLFPEQQPQNPERREKLLAEQGADAPAKEYNQRMRSVRTSAGDIDPQQRLREQYTNKEGEMVCQICKEEMPFKKRNHEYYFEAVELLSKEYLPKEHEVPFLALCPVCAAKYKEFVKSDEEAMRELHCVLKDADELDVSLKLGEETSIRFVGTHRQDIRTILESYRRS